jgi:hypothetical protein
VELTEAQRTELDKRLQAYQANHVQILIKNPTAKTNEETSTMILIEHPPKMVYDGAGRLIEVILSAADFQAYLRSLLAEKDWETLPKHLQDAVDLLLIDEVRNEKKAARNLDAVLAELGDHE